SKPMPSGGSAAPGRPEKRGGCYRDCVCLLQLPVIFKHPSAGHREFGAMFLQTGQNGEIALIEHVAAIALCVTRTCLLFVYRATPGIIGHSSGGKSERRQGESEKIFTHHVPLF